LSTNNFPSLSKSKQVQDTIKFKVSSKAQKGVKFDTSVNNYDATTTEAEFSSKINLEEVKGIELGFKAKSKPSAEFSIKATDELIPLSGGAVTAKLAAAAKSDQTVGLSFTYGNQWLNSTFGFSYPISVRLFDFIENNEDLTKQQPKVDVDAVVKPFERDLYVGGNASISLPTEHSPLTYTSKVAFGINNKIINGGVFIEHKKEKDKGHQNKLGAWAFTEVEDLSGGAQVTYSADEVNPYKGFTFEAAVALQRDADSKLSSKVQIVPDPIVSLGYEQKLSPSVKLSLGYSFLLAKASSEAKTKNSAFSVGVELSH